MVNVADASTPIQLDAVRELIRTFIAWHRERHVQDLQLIDEYFDTTRSMRSFEPSPASTHHREDACSSPLWGNNPQGALRFGPLITSTAR